MEKIKSELLIKIFDKNRNECNKLFSRARHFNINLKADVFKNYILTSFDEYAEYLKNIDFDKAEKIIMCLYEIFLKLLTSGYLGKEGKYPGFESSFFTLIKKFYLLAVDEPYDFFAMIINALTNLIDYDVNIMNKWFSVVKRFPEDINISDFKTCGFIAAWKSGVACYRKEALLLAENINTKYFNVIFETDFTEKDIPKVVNFLKNNKWCNINEYKNPQQNKELFIKPISGFSAFNGKFKSITNVKIADENFVISDIDWDYILFADYYGSILIPVQKEVYKNQREKSAINTVVNNDMITFEGKLYKIPRPFNISVNSYCSTGDTLVYTSDLSFKVFIAYLRSV